MHKRCGYYKKGEEVFADGGGGGKSQQMKSFYCLNILNLIAKKNVATVALILAKLYCVHVCLCLCVCSCVYVCVSRRCQIIL